MGWRSVGTVAISDLVDARLQLHHAAQIVAAGGATLLDPAPDDSHPNLGWDDALGALVGRPLTSRGPRLALEIEGFAIALIGADGRRIERVDLEGRSFAEVLAEAAAALERGGLSELSDRALCPPGYELPRHVVEGGTAFTRPDAAVATELAAWFGNAHEALSTLAGRQAGTPEVRVWPHHFDAGSLFTVATDEAGEATATVGFGLSPGDGAYAEPYWYVSPWPTPDGVALPALGAQGRWHTEGFTAAVWTATEMADASLTRPADAVAAFLARGVEACRALLVSDAPS